MKNENVISNVLLDKARIEKLREMRAIRIQTTESLLLNLDSTLNDLVESGQICRSEVDEEFVEGLKDTLRSRLGKLLDRQDIPFFFKDELALYPDAYSLHN